MKIIKYPFWIIELILIWAFIIPFSIGKIHFNLLKSPIMLLIYWSSFLVALLFVILYVIFKDNLLIKLALSFDQLGNTALNGSEDNTLSGRLGKKILRKRANFFERRICYILSKIDPTTNTHCLNSIEDHAA
jgi:hypothetical protein